MRALPIGYLIFITKHSSLNLNIFIFPQATENVLKWESEYLKVLKNESNLYYQAGRSFGDISSTTTFKEMDKLMIGMIFMFCYVLTILSRFNRIEIRVSNRSIYHYLNLYE